MARVEDDFGELIEVKRLNEVETHYRVMVRGAMAAHGVRQCAAFEDRMVGFLMQVYRAANANAALHGRKLY